MFVTGDAALESDETFGATITSVAGGKIGAGTAAVTLLNDDVGVGTSVRPAGPEEVRRHRARQCRGRGDRVPAGLAEDVSGEVLVGRVGNDLLVGGVGDTFLGTDARDVVLRRWACSAARLRARCIRPVPR